jgi:dodecin
LEKQPSQASQALRRHRDAVKEAVARATKTLRGVEGAWVKDQNVLIEDGNITSYKVNVEVTFLLEE